MNVLAAFAVIAGTVVTAAALTLFGLAVRLAQSVNQRDHHVAEGSEALAAILICTPVHEPEVLARKAEHHA